MHTKSLRAPAGRTAGRVAGTLAAGGTAALLTSWAAGRLVQREPVARSGRALYEFCRRHRSARLTRRMDTATTLGDYGVIGSFSVLVGGLLAYQRRSWRPLPLLAGGVVSEVYLQKAIKKLVRGSLPPSELSIGPPGDYPSGGAARTVIVFGLLAHLLAQEWPRCAERSALWSIAAVLVAAQGGSRLYLGRHWPEDVAGGWLLGVLILATLITADGAVPAVAAGRPAALSPGR